MVAEKKEERKIPCLIFSRVVGYLRPVKYWNVAKRQEFKDRKPYSVGKKEKGQGLVEMALILPFLLILIIGIVEGSIALQRQLIVVNAAREGARFGAYGATADDIHAQTLLATSRMFEFTEENAVITIIQARTNNAGNAFNKLVENVYPGSKKAPRAMEKEVLADLRGSVGCSVENQSRCVMASNLEVVVVDVRYDHHSVFGFPILGALADRIPIGSRTVMRVHW